MLHTTITPSGAAPPGLPGGALPEATDPPGRMAQFMRLLSDLDPDEIATLVDLSIARLDARDGDPDLEDGGDDEEDGTDAGDQAWIEWDSRGRHKHDRHGAEPLGRDRGGFELREDDEDDDPAEDGHDAEQDDEREAGSWPETDGERSTGVHAYGDDEREDDDPARRRPYLHAARARSVLKRSAPPYLVSLRGCPQMIGRRL